MAPQTLKIGQLAERVGVSPRTIRYYEQAGVLPTPDAPTVGIGSTGHRTRRACGSSEPRADSASRSNHDRFDPQAGRVVRVGQIQDG